MTVYLFPKTESELSMFDSDDVILDINIGIADFESAVDHHQTRKQTNPLLNLMISEWRSRTENATYNELVEIRDEVCDMVEVMAHAEEGGL